MCCSDIILFVCFVGCSLCFAHLLLSLPKIYLSECIWVECMNEMETERDRNMCFVILSSIEINKLVKLLKWNVSIKESLSKCELGFWWKWLVNTRSVYSIYIYVCLVLSVRSKNKATISWFIGLPLICHFINFVFN